MLESLCARTNKSLLFNLPIVSSWEISTQFMYLPCVLPIVIHICMYMCTHLSWLRRGNPPSLCSAAESRWEVVEARWRACQHGGELYMLYCISSCISSCIYLPNYLPNYLQVYWRKCTGVGVNLPHNRRIIILNALAGLMPGCAHRRPLLLSVLRNQ